MRCWKVLASLRCSVMVSPGHHNTGVETFQEQIKLYELWITHEAAPTSSTMLFTDPCCYFLLFFPSFFLILNFPLEAYIKIQKRFCWLDPQPSTPTTVTAQQLAVGECWAGLGLGCWVELETQVRKVFTITEKAHTKAFSWLKALTLDSLSQGEGSCRGLLWTLWKLRGPLLPALLLSQEKLRRAACGQRSNEARSGACGQR